MSIPVQPTETTIVQKAYRLYGKSNPTTTDLTNAINDGIAKVKEDLMEEGREWSPLRRTSYTAVTINVNHIQAPTDHSKPISAVILDGTRADTAQTGTTTTITLASTDTGTVNDTEGKLVVIKGGTGAGQARQIQDYDSGTKIATVDETWTAPDNTSTYLIVDEQKDLHLKQVWNYDEIQQTHLKDKPINLYHMADDAEGDFYFDYTPDKEYVVRLRYYSDLRKEDTDTSANPRYARILRLFEQVFIQGVFVWLLQDDSRIQLELPIYSNMIVRKAGELLYPNSSSQSGKLAEDVY